LAVKGKMTKFHFLFLLIFIPGCSNSKNDNSSTIDTTPLPNCPEPKLKQIYFDQGCNGDKCGYFHTVMLQEYNEACFNNYNFVFIADKYLDSVKSKLPVKAIYFVKPFDFQPTYDSADFEPLNAHSIVGIGYTDNTMHQKVPQIERISIWTNGERKTLEYLEIAERSSRMKYYNSKR
jgi:hypothetical protein